MFRRAALDGGTGASSGRIGQGESEKTGHQANHNFELIIPTAAAGSRSTIFSSEIASEGVEVVPETETLMAVVFCPGSLDKSKPIRQNRSAELKWSRWRGGVDRGQVLWVWATI